jgi:hypothetical protein
MDVCCVSCLRLHSRQNVTKYKNGKNEENDAKLLLTEKTLNFGHYYLCRTCRPGLIKGFPKLNWKKTGDINKIGSIPRQLPDLNLMERYLLKLTIPFIRVAHIPRTPNLKLVGGTINIQADIKHSIDRLQINSENIIPVSFKRKLKYKGHYIEQVINKEKLFKWIAFLKENNPFYKNILEETEVEKQIDVMSSELKEQLVAYDEYRVLKEQLNEQKEKEEKIITEDIFLDLTDDENDEENLGEDTKTEELGKIYLL